MSWGGALRIAAPALSSFTFLLLVNDKRASAYMRELNNIKDSTFLKAKQVAAILHSSVPTVYRLAKVNQLKSHRIGRKVVFLESDTKEYLRKIGLLN